MHPLPSFRYIYSMPSMILKISFIVFIIFIANLSLIGQVDETSEMKSDQMYQRGRALYYDGAYLKAERVLDSVYTFRKEIYPEYHEAMFQIQLRRGKNYLKQRKLDKAGSCLDDAYIIAGKVFGPESIEVADVLVEKAGVASKALRIKEALSYNQQAIKITSAKYGPKSLEVAYLVMNIAIDVYKMGDFRKCIDLNQQVLEIYEKELEPHDENFNRVYNNIALAYRKVGDLEKALQYGEKALEIKLLNYPKVHPSVPKYYANIGRILTQMHRYEEAENYYLQSVQLAEASGATDPADLASSYGDMGLIFADNGDLEKAYTYFEKGVNILEENNNTNSFSYLAGRLNLALTTYEIKDTLEGITMMEEVYKMFREQGNGLYNRQVEVLLTLGAMYEEIGKVERAKELVFDARSILNENLEKQDHLLELRVLLAESELSEYGGIVEMKEGLSKMDSVIHKLTQMRKRYLGEASKQFLNEELEDIFDQAVSLSVKLYEASEVSLSRVFSYIEMAKAASFWDHESEEQAFFYGKVPENVIANIELLKEQISDLEYFSHEGNEEVFRDSIFYLNSSLNDQLKKLEVEYPRFYKYKYDLNIPSLKSIQQRMPRDIGIIDYYLNGDEVIALLLLKNKVQLFKSKLEGDWSDHFQITGSMFSEMDRSKAMELHSVLFEDIEPILRKYTVNRVSIIPHQELCYLSFDQLVNPISRKYLIENYAFSYQYNITTLFSEHSSRGKIDYLGVAPFGGDDFEGNSGLMAMRNEGLVPLPGSIREIETSGDLLKGMVKIGNDATESFVKKDIQRHNVLHFATHAFIDPERSSNARLYLAKGSEEEDGILYLDEINNLDLDAELVILSACNTGNGKLKSGEGVMSLSRSFQYAGAESLLMSLWLANDESSTPIISQFLENVKKGQPKDLALQNAKLKYLNEVDPFLQEQFFWAGFLLNGNVSPIVTSQTANSGLMMIAVSILLALFWLSYRFQRKNKLNNGILTNSAL